MGLLLKFLRLIKWCFTTFVLCVLTLQCTNENTQAELEDLKNRISELNRQVTDAHVRIEDLNNRLFVIQEKQALGNREAVPQNLKVVKLVPEKPAKEKPAVGNSKLVDVNSLPLKKRQQKKEPVLISNWDDPGSLKTKQSKKVASGKSSRKKMQNDYKNALDLFKARKFNEAIVAFTEFQASCKVEDYKDNASFWIARSYFEKADFETAEKKFSEVLKFKNSNKIADSLLFLGMIARSRGDNENARKYWQRLIRDFPREPTAKKAMVELEEIKTKPQAD